jgi:hypothetical protein
MTGEGNYAEAVQQLFKTAKRKYFQGRSMPAMDLTKFRKGGNFSLF